MSTSAEVAPSAANMPAWIAQTAMLYKVLVSRPPFDSASTDVRPRRKRRAIVIGAVAVVLVATAVFTYLRSSPGGVTRQPPATPSSNPLLVSLSPINYDFVTPSLGWAAENTFTAASGAGQFRVFRTVDGAKQWQLQLTGPSTWPGLMPITVQFFDTTHGFLTLSLAFTGEQVYRTWLLYLTCSSVAFATGSIGLYQVLMQKQWDQTRGPDPTIREGIYAGW